MKVLEELAGKYIKKESNNIYRVENYSDSEEDIKKAIIRAKNALASKTIAFSLDDFVLVRITDERNYPRNFKYFPNDETNSWKKIENPFFPIVGYLKYNVDEFYRTLDVGCPHEDINYEKFNIITPRYRDTKHFSINSLASNVNRLFFDPIRFDKEKAVIIIEPLKERITDSRLAILNPVDTFFDIHETPLDISPSAIFMVQEVFYNELDDLEFKEKLPNYQVFIYKDNPALAVDLVLSYLGYIPQRSYHQSFIKSQYFFDNGIEVNDEEYIKQYQNYMEYLNQFYLHTSYLEVPEIYAKVRRESARDYIGMPGVLHSETKYRVSEQARNLESDIKTYQEYITYIFSLAGINDKVRSDYLHLVKEDVLDIGNDPVERTFFQSFRAYEELLRAIIVKLTYPVFDGYTKKFNEHQLSKKDIKHQG